MAPRIHRLIRMFALIAIAASLTYMAQRSNARTDLTAEGLSQITPNTQELIEGIDETQPVVVTAYVSKDVPRPYVALRARLLNILNEMDASGGAGLTVRIYEPEPFSTEAEEAIEKFGIMPRPLMDTEGGNVDTKIVFLGVAFTSGPREEVVPFLDRGLSVEYELARALQVVTQDKKKVVGIMRDDTKLMGDFDLQARRRIPPWQIIAELEKQYEVQTLAPEMPIPPEVDVLLVPQASSLSQANIDVVLAYLLAGRPALILADPMPFFNLKLSPNQPMLPPPQQQGMMGGAGGEAKGDFRGLLRAIGVEWQDQNIAFDLDNPEAQLADAPRNVIVVGQRSNWDPFAGKGQIVEGLAQIVVLFGGDLRPAEGGTTDFAPLLVTGTRGGWDSFGDMTDDSNFLFGIQFKGVPSDPTNRAADKGMTNVVLGARITGGGSSGQPDINAIVLADLDMFADTFFSFHERGGDLDGDGLIDLRFDNVTFLLNALDDLLGDDRFIELRKRQPEFRRLDKVDDMTEAANLERQDQIKAANDAAKQQITSAQEALNEAVAAIKSKTDLDETTKQIMIRSAEEAENRRLQAQTEQIEREKAQAVDKIKAEHARAIDEVRDRIRVLAILIPPIPAILLGLVIFYRKRRRESAAIPETRKRRQA